MEVKLQLTLLKRKWNSMEKPAKHSRSIWRAINLTIQILMILLDVLFGSQYPTVKPSKIFCHEIRIHRLAGQYGVKK